MKVTRSREFLSLAACMLAAGACLAAVLTGRQPMFARPFSPQNNQAQPAARALPKSDWTIGIYTGPSPFHLTEPANVKNPVVTARDVTDTDAEVVAHPFMAVTGGGYYMFFTVKKKTGTAGAIGLAESKNGTEWKYRQVVLEEPFHLSYPFVFQWQDGYYMIPEGGEGTGVRIYRAREFPTKWQYVKDLVQGGHFISPSIVRYRDRWWLFASLPGNETLRLYHADDLMGPWAQHPGNPIVPKDMHIARPGGRPLIVDGTLYRLAQDDYPTYGLQVFALRVTDISTTSYKEEMVDMPIVKATKKGWNAHAMHHVDLHRAGQNHWIAAVDGVHNY